MAMWIPDCLSTDDDDAHTGQHEPYWAMMILMLLVRMVNLLHYSILENILLKFAGMRPYQYAEFHLP